MIRCASWRSASSKSNQTWEDMEAAYQSQDAAGAGARITWMTVPGVAKTISPRSVSVTSR